MSTPIRLALAFAVGALLGGGIAAALDSGESVPEPERATTTVAAAASRIVEAPWVEDGVRFRSTVVVPRSFVVGEGRADLEFELRSLHWVAETEDGADLAPVAVRPERWELITHSGAVVSSETDVEATRVRFAVAENVEAEDVAVVQVVVWRVAVPQGASIRVPLESGADDRFPDGTAVEVDTVLEQSSSTIVQLATHTPDDSFVGHGVTPIAAPHPRWRVSGRTGNGLQLTWEGADAPGDIELVQAYPAWLPTEARTVVIGEADG